MAETLLNDSLSFPKSIRLPNLFIQQKDEWTIAIHLTGAPSSEAIMLELKRLITQTEDRDITIIVQTTADRGSMAFPGRSLPQSVTKKTHVIRKGELKTLESGHSEGYAKDLQRLLSFATQNYPSKQIGLLINSHGGGNWGLSADTGFVSMHDLIKVLVKGLRNSKHEQLDLLEIEDCLMGKNGAYHEVACMTRSVLPPSARQNWANDSDIIGRLKNVLKKMKNNKPSKQELSFCEDISCVPLTAMA